MSDCSGATALGFDDRPFSPRKMIKSMKFLEISKEIVREWFKHITHMGSTYYFKCSKDRDPGLNLLFWPNCPFSVCENDQDVFQNCKDNKEPACTIRLTMDVIIEHC